MKKQYPDPLRLDLGCGKNKRVDVDAQGAVQKTFWGVDNIKFDNVDEVVDLRKKWPWADESVEEVFSSHFVEHLTGTERIHFFNELHRVLKPKGLAFIVTPDWSNDCAYGDPSHAWPPMSRWYPLYLDKNWRDAQAPHVPYTCDFDYSIAGQWEDWLTVRNPEFQNFATQHYVNSLRDLHVGLTKR